MYFKVFNVVLVLVLSRGLQVVYSVIAIQGAVIKGHLRLVYFPIKKILPLLNTYRRSHFTLMFIEMIVGLPELSH